MPDLFGRYSSILVILTYVSYGVVGGIMFIHVIIADHLIEKSYTSKLAKHVVSLIWSAFKLLAFWGVFIVLMMTSKAYPEVDTPLNFVIAIASLVGTVYFHGKYIRQDAFRD